VISDFVEFLSCQVVKMMLETGQTGFIDKIYDVSWTFWYRACKQFTLSGYEHHGRKRKKIMSL